MSHDKKRKVFEKQEASYLQLFELVCSLQINPDHIYEDNYFEQLNQLRFSLKLFASVDTLNIFEEFYQDVRQRHGKFYDKFVSNASINEKEMRRQFEGTTDDIFKREEDEFAKANQISSEQLTAYISKMTQQMRFDIGTDKLPLDKVLSEIRQFLCEAWQKVESLWKKNTE